MRATVFLSIILLIAVPWVCALDEAIDARTAADEAQKDAERLAKEVLKLLPEGWKLAGCAVEEAPRRWSGRTTALMVGFQHQVLKFSLDGINPASFALWRTPLDYSGEALPTNLAQPGGALPFGRSNQYQWFIEGLLPAEEDWAPIRQGLIEHFGITATE